jgi:hypothetical protein
MIVRRLLVGLLLTGLAVPALAAAPHPREPRQAREALPPIPAGSTSRVFARAESGAEPAAASPEPAESPVAASLPSLEIAARARAEFEANRAGRIDRTHYSAAMNEKITDAALADTSANLRLLGEVRRFVQVRKITQGSLAVYIFKIEGERAPTIEQVIGWNAEGKVDVLQFGVRR